MGLSISSPPRLMRSPRWHASPSAVPTTSAKMTAGIFSISGIEEMPIPIAHTPKTLLSSVVKRVERFLPNIVPQMPPMTTAITLTMIPIIDFLPSLFLQQKPPKWTSPSGGRSISYY